MDADWRESLRQQFGAAIEMLAQARLWDDPLAAFWNVAFHALFWLDLYLSGSPAGFAPPAPFTLDELDPAGKLPERAYTREELRGYAAHTRAKCEATIAGLTDEQARRRQRVSRAELSFGELLLYTMRHVQEHAAQLQLLIGQHGGTSSGWVARATR